MLYLGDCIEVMGNLPPGSVDLTVTSPPYDNIRTYNDTLNDWNEVKWRAVLAGLYRVTKPGGVVVWVVGDAVVDGSETGTSFRQALHAMTCGFRLHDTMIWTKPDYKPLTHNRYEQTFEYMFIFSKGPPRTFEGIKDKPNVGYGRKVTGTWRDSAGTMHAMSGVGKKTIAEFGLRGNVWSIATKKGKRKDNHPPPFPELLVKDHVLSWSNPCDTVLDPFLGSGVTGVVCRDTNRKFIGIERDTTYFEMARRHIETMPWEVPQLSLSE